MSAVLERCADGFSRVVRCARGRPVVCIGGGASLSAEQIERVSRSDAIVIAVNDAYLWAPFADLLLFGDPEWWDWHTKGIAKPRIGMTADAVRAAFATFAGQKATVEPTSKHVRDPGVHRLRTAGATGLSLDADRIFTGRNTGFMALNVAVLAGAELVILIGYDAREPKDGEVSHWHGGHPRREPDVVYKQHRASFTAVENDLRALGVRVVNCSPGTAIKSFDTRPLEAVLPVVEEDRFAHG